MNRDKYKRRASALRKLMRQLTPVREANQSVIEYNFGAVVDPSTLLWHVYNYNSNNCIATVNFTDTHAVIRYRQNSFYSGVLKSFTYKLPTISISSTNLSQRRRWIRDQLQTRVRASYRASTRDEQRVLTTTQLENANARVVTATNRLTEEAFHRGFASFDSLDAAPSTPLVINNQRYLRNITNRSRRLPTVNDSELYTAIVNVPIFRHRLEIIRDRNGRWRDRRGRFVSSPASYMSELN